MILISAYEIEVRNIKFNVNDEQIKIFMDTHFNMKCDHCDTVFDTLKTARAHYLLKHRIQQGYLKCCTLTFATNTSLVDHIQWHLNSDTFKYDFNPLIYLDILILVID